MAIAYTPRIEDALWMECFNTPYPIESDPERVTKFNKWLRHKYHAEIVWSKKKEDTFAIELEFSTSKDETFFGLKHA